MVKFVAKLVMELSQVRRVREYWSAQGRFHLGDSFHW